jgi:hypothetical protein
MAVEELRLSVQAKVAIGLQASVCVIVLGVWLMWASWGVFPNSLVLSSLIFLPGLGLCVVAVLGLTKGKMYGWVTGVLGNSVSSAALFVFAGPFGFLPAALVVYLLVPGVRNFYLRNYYY